MGWQRAGSSTPGIPSTPSGSPPRSRPTTGRDGRGTGAACRFTSFGASELANAVFGALARTTSGPAGRRSALDYRTRCRARTTPRSPAAANMRTSPRSSSSGRSGPACSGSTGAGGRCSNRHRHRAVPGADAGGVARPGPRGRGEIDPVTARIARLLQPRARIVNADLPAPSFRPASTSPSAIRRSPIELCARTAAIGRWGSGCMTISSPARSIS